MHGRDPVLCIGVACNGCRIEWFEWSFEYTVLSKLHVFDQARPTEAFPGFPTRGFFHTWGQPGEIVGYPGCGQAICKVKTPYAGWGESGISQPEPGEYWDIPFGIAISVMLTSHRRRGESLGCSNRTPGESSGHRLVVLKGDRRHGDAPGYSGRTSGESPGHRGRDGVSGSAEGR